jgi:hypothetical protein
MSGLAYIARRPGCGCICFASTPEAMTDADTVREVAQMLREGYSIERLSAAEVRAGQWECEKCKPGTAEHTDMFTFAKEESK